MMKDKLNIQVVHYSIKLKPFWYNTLQKIKFVILDSFFTLIAFSHFFSDFWLHIQKNLYV